MSDFDRKLLFLAKQLAWSFAFLLFLPFWLFGIYTGVQYMNDDCVRGGAFSLALDYWLVLACVYDIVFSCVVLLLLCCHTPGSQRKWIVGPMHIVNFCWLGIGIVLIIESNVRCQHNTLWVMSIVNVSVKGTAFLLALAIWISSRLGMCRRLENCITLEETPYDAFHPATVHRNDRDDDNDY